MAKEGKTKLAAILFPKSNVLKNESGRQVEGLTLIIFLSVFSAIALPILKERLQMSGVKLLGLYTGSIFVILVLLVIFSYLGDIFEEIHQLLSNRLQRAARKGNAAKVSKLLQKGTIVNQRGRENETALITASQHGHLSIVKLLLERGARVNRKNICGETALMMAAKEGYADIVEILLDKNADINVKNNSGKGALKLAGRNGHQDIVEILRKKQEHQSKVLNDPFLLKSDTREAGRAGLTATLLIDYKATGPLAPSWNSIEEDLWRKIVNRFVMVTCDAFAFKGIGSLEELKGYAPFKDWLPEAKDINVKYVPESIAVDDPEPEDYYESVSLFNLTDRAVELILSVPFAGWSVLDEDVVKTDEILFFQESKLKVQAVPYEDEIFFLNLTEKELNFLDSIDDAILKNLHY